MTATSRSIIALLFLAIFPLALLAHPAPGTPRQMATITNLELSEGDSLAGVSGMRISFDVQMKYPGKVLISGEDNSIPYDILVRVFDETGIPLPATPDAVDFSNADGEVQDSTRANLHRSRQDFNGRSAFLPYYALGLQPGKRKIKIAVEVRDARNGELAGKSELRSFLIEMPRVKRFRMDMHRIIVSDKDSRDDSWDYYFLNKREILPDVRWSILRGKKIVFRGEKQKNTTVYEGDPEKDRTIWFSLAEGDLLSLYVHDFDLITFSDEIGQVTLDPWASAGNDEQDLAFGQVTSARFVLLGLNEPQMKLSRFEVKEAARVEGVTGVRVSFNYELEYDILGIRFQVEFSEQFGQEAQMPRFVRVTDGPAEKLEGSTFALTGNKGRVEFFLPHYGLDPDPEKDALLRMATNWVLDGQKFDLEHRDRQLLRKADPVADLEFGQWKAGEVIREGIAGLLFTCEYRLADRYLTELDSAVVRILPEMKTQQGSVPPGYLQYIAPKNATWVDDALILSPEVDSSSMDLFLPYYMLPADLPDLVLNMHYGTELKWEGRSIPLGEFSLQQDMQLPPRMNLSIRVAEVAAKREKRIFTQPGLEWRVYLGNVEKYRSRIIPHEKTTLRWREDEVADILLSEKDLIRIEIYREAGNTDPFRIGFWEGTTVDFPPTKKGFRDLEVEGLKKLQIVVK